MNARAPEHAAYLAGILPFKTLTPDTLTAVARGVEELRYERDQVLFSEGDISDAVFVARSGRVRLQHFRPDGSVRTVCMIGPGETFCCLPAMDAGTNPATAVAAEPSIVYRIPGGAYRELLETRPAFSREALRHFCGRLREAGCEGCSQAEDAGARLAGKILTMVDKFGDVVPLTRKELGELAGTTVETAIRITRDFEERGWLALGRGNLRVLDRAALQLRTLGPAAPTE